MAVWAGACRLHFLLLFICAFLVRYFLTWTVFAVAKSLVYPFHSFSFLKLQENWWERCDLHAHSGTRSRLRSTGQSHRTGIPEKHCVWTRVFPGISLVQSADCHACWTPHFCSLAFNGFFMFELLASCLLLMIVDFHFPCVIRSARVLTKVPTSKLRPNWWKKRRSVNRKQCYLKLDRKDDDFNFDLSGGIDVVIKCIILLSIVFFRNWYTCCTFWGVSVTYQIYFFSELSSLYLNIHFCTHNNHYVPSKK